MFWLMLIYKHLLFYCPDHHKMLSSLFVILLVQSFSLLCLASTDILQSPICRAAKFDNILSEEKFIIRGSSLLHDKLFLTVFDVEQNLHIVHEIPLIDINIKDHEIYLDNSIPKTMKEKWGFEPADSNQTILSTVSITNFGPYNQTDQEDVIIFIFANTSKILRLKSNKLENGFKWNKNVSFLYSPDNEGYYFEWDRHWFVRESQFRRDQFSQSNEKYFVLLNSNHNLVILKKIGPRVDEQLIDWKQFTGFLFYNYIYIFSESGIFLLMDNREFGKTGFEHHLAYKMYNYRHFFKCIRLHSEPHESYNNIPNREFDTYKNGEPLMVNLILLGLLVVVIGAFCLRVKMSNKQHYNRIYLKNKY